MSPELETLDELQGGDLPIAVVSRFYSDADAFRKGIGGLLSCGDVSLLTADESVVPEWRWKKLLAENAFTEDLRVCA